MIMLDTTDSKKDIKILGNNWKRYAEQSQVKAKF